MNRRATIERNTKETQIKLEINLDGSGQSKVNTGVGFLNHMLDLFAKHSSVDIDLQATGDIDVDCHHTVEDIGIVLGKGLLQALQGKECIKRYGFACIPMEEALATCVIDISGRAYLNFDVNFTTQRLGDLDSEMIEEFFRAICINAGLNIHIFLNYGKNNHHIAEAIFKAFAHSIAQAITIDPKLTGVLSTKGMLE